jgi:hypothetical protein
VPVMNVCEQCGAGPSSPAHHDRNAFGKLYHRFRSPIMTRAEEHARLAGIDFDEAGHLYTIPDGGRRVPSVTEVLKDNGLVDYSFCTALARERGSAAHEAIHFDVEGDLDTSSLDPIVAPYVEAARVARQALEVEPILAEAVVFSALYGYAGKLDLLAYLRGRRRLVVIDWKTGAAPPAVALQLAGYAGAWHEMTGEVVLERIAIQLQPAERIPYKLHEFSDRGDLGTFRGAAGCTNWRRKHAA